MWVIAVNYNFYICQAFVSHSTTYRLCVHVYVCVSYNTTHSQIKYQELYLYNIRHYHATTFCCLDKL
jgi:hypothetical protein